MTFLFFFFKVANFIVRYQHSKTVDIFIWFFYIFLILIWFFGLFSVNYIEASHRLICLQT